MPLHMRENSSCTFQCVSWSSCEFSVVNFFSLPVCDIKLYWKSMPELHRFSAGWSGNTWGKCWTVNLHVRWRIHPLHGLIRVHLMCTYAFTCFPPQPSNLWGYWVYHTDKDVKKNFSYVPCASGFVKCARYVTVNLTSKNKPPNYYSFLNIVKTSFATPIFLVQC